MRYFALPGRVAGALAAGVTLVGLLAPPAFAAPGSPTRTDTASAVHTSAAPTPTGSTRAASGRAVQDRPMAPSQLPPLRPAVSPHDPDALAGPVAASKEGCSPADFGGRTGAALVALVRASTVECVDSLFGVTGADAGRVFAESQMVTVAKAFAGTARRYGGDNSARIWQLVLFLRAGYYVQFNNPADTGPYGARLTAATARGLDAFFARRHAWDVTSANGDVLGDVVILTDSADLQGRYLNAYRRLLNGYNDSYDSVASMVAAVNDVYTPLWRGNWNTAYVNAVAADPRIIGTLHTFALHHMNLLGSDRAYLDSNAGMGLARHIEHPGLTALVRPPVKDLLGASRITGPTAQLWVAVATQVDAYDRAGCSYYDVCDLTDRLSRAALPVTHDCDATHTIRAQSLTAADLDATCASLLGQDPYMHDLVKDEGPIPGQYESTVHLVVFAGRADYQTYAGAIFGVSTDNGGITLVGDPSDPHNQPVSVMYQKPYDDGFTARIWNLNHEYTHYLDARDDMKGDFTQQTAVPDIWWIEGLAEYVSYSYRGITDAQAVAEAGKHTYTLSTLFQSTYANSDLTRTYPWGYLAVRYMVEKHPQDIQRMLARFRAGDYPGGYAVYSTGIGTRYDADFDAWLTACATGACAGPGTGALRPGGARPVH
ncbi:collagenase [Streptomyces glomeratus]|uniref:microbial collagenase n=1 Tax=Streptomyces glomeratus TaxID=284452 RepID=A0ABP6LUY6_9ACTN|nr:collagenase [Streptomyces glomeratus]MCF1510172.1 collagenase [Streptomyces glomeratus]